MESEPCRLEVPVPAALSSDAQFSELPSLQQLHRLLDLIVVRPAAEQAGRRFIENSDHFPVQLQS